jgi:bifunctional DNase/RNase
MKIALEPYMFRRVPLTELPGLVADLGYQYLELSPREDFLPFFVHRRADQAQIAGFRRALSAAGGATWPSTARHDGGMTGDEEIAAVTDIGFVEMRVGKVVAVAEGHDDLSFCVVLDGVSQDRHLPIAIGEIEAFNLCASLTGVEFARPMSPQFAAGLLRALGGRVRQVRIDRLVPVAGGTAYGSTVEVAGASGTELVDARPSDSLNLAALVPAPIFVAPEVLADAEARLDGDSAEASQLRLALECQPMTIQQGPSAR